MTDDPIEQFRKMASEDIAPYKARACGTCRHRPRRFTGFTHCKATGEFIDIERRYNGACGRDGKLWEPLPPRLGIFGWLKRIVFGGPR